MNIINETKAIPHEDLLRMHEEESSTLIRDLKIRILSPIKSTTKRGHPITFMAWEYMNPEFEDYGWKHRKSPMYSNEAKLLIDNGPYDENDLYRVTAHKDHKDFWVWSKIEKINSNTKTQGADHE